MGYRNYIGVLPKTAVEEVKACKTNDELFEVFKKYNWDYDEYDDRVYLPVFGIDLKNEYELGKYYDSDSVLSHFTDVFDKDSELCDHDCEFKIANDSDAAFRAIIDDYRKRVVNYFKSLLQDGPDNDSYYRDRIRYSELPEDEKYKWKFERLQTEIQTKADDWEKFPPYILDRKYKSSVCSCLYEYAIFELVRLYKEFDPETEVLVFTGH